MIDQTTLAIFFDEMKTAMAPPPAAVGKMSKSMKALLGVTAVGGVAAGVKGDQARRDLMTGRAMRRSQRGY